MSLEVRAWIDLQRFLHGASIWCCVCPHVQIFLPLGIFFTLLLLMSHLYLFSSTYFVGLLYCT